MRFNHTGFILHNRPAVQQSFPLKNKQKTVHIAVSFIPNSSLLFLRTKIKNTKTLKQLVCPCVFKRRRCSATVDAIHRPRPARKTEHKLKQTKPKPLVCRGTRRFHSKNKQCSKRQIKLQKT